MEAEALNITAVLVGAVAGFALGAVIYNPKVLGSVWAKGSGVDLDAGTAPPVLAFAAQGLALLCLAIVVGMTATVNFLGTAVLAILGAALFVVSHGAFVRKSTAAMLIDGLYVVGAGVLMILAQGIF